MPEIRSAWEYRYDAETGKVEIYWAEEPEKVTP